MVTFRYKALNSAGGVVTGVLEAPSGTAAAQALRKDGYFPISTVNSAHVWSAPFCRLTSRDRIKLRSLQKITDELATLTDAGLEIDRSLSIVVSLTENDADGRAFARIQERLRAGASFSTSLAQEREIPAFYIAMVQAGEIGGTLPSTLKRLSGYLTRDMDLRGTVVSALIYPAILLCSAMIAITIILTVVLPEFEPLFAAAGKSLPLPTRIVMGVAAAITSYWWAMGLMILSGYLWSRRALSDKGRRQQFDARSLDIPLIGRLIRSIQMERLFRTLGTLLQSGTPLADALTLAGKVLRNSAMAAHVQGVAKKVREGHSFVEQLASSTLFPRSSLNLIAVGEETGRLDEMLIKQADADDAHIRRSIERLLAIFVPTLTIMLGLIIAALIASMLVAILSVNDLALQ